MDNVLIGKRLRQLRFDRNLRQSDVAKQLGVSPAYLNLIEKGKRTIQFPLLWRALQIFDQDLEVFMSSLGEKRPDDALAKLLDDPLAKSLDLEEDDLARLTAEPKAATTIAALFNLYKNTRAQLDTAVARLSAGEVPRLDYAPGDEVSDFLGAHKNFFPELEAEADRIRAIQKLPRRVISDHLVAVLENLFDYRVERRAPTAGSVVRRIDIDQRKITISTGLSEQAQKFQLAATCGLLTLDATRLHERLIADARPRHSETPRLIKIHLANYFAGALLLPYDDYFREVQRTHYDVEALAEVFEMSYEACAHRLCNLSDPRRPAIPLHFLRVDVAGNISKKYSGTGIRFPSTGSGSCPKWAVHQAFLTPSSVTRQYSMMPDGTLYFCFAKTAIAPQQGSLARGTTYSIGLGTHADVAKHLAYAQDLLSPDVKRVAVPTGVTCRFCERTDCNQRAAPSYKFAFAVDEYTKKDNFFSPLTTAANARPGT
jgi:XRE family transcriptional regulator, fatty acid utilization regulator